MKNYIKHFALLLFTIFSACDKEATFITAFDFTIEETHNNTSSIDLEERTQFEISPEREIENTVYEFTYVVTEGEGYYVDQNGDKLLENFVYEIKDLIFSYDFVGKTEGDVRTTVNISNSEYDHDIILNYDVIVRSFSFTATSSLSTIEAGQQININYNITEVSSAIEDTYTLKYSSSQNGVLSIDGTSYEPGTVILLESLDFNAQFDSDAQDEVIITSEITALSNGQTVERQTIVTYDAATFTMSVTSQEEVTVGESLEVEFILNETNGNSNFDIQYTVSGDPQQFVNSNGTVLEPNVNYDVESNTFKLTLNALDEGSMTVNYIVTNQYGVSQEYEVIYAILPISFDFTVVPTSTSFYTDSSIKLSVEMDAPTSLTYKMNVNSNGKASITYEEDTFEEGEEFTIANEDLIILYNSESNGSNVINMTIEGSNGFKVTKTINITLIQKTILSQFVITDYFYDCRIDTQCKDRTVQRFTIRYTSDPSINVDFLRVKINGVTKNISFSEAELSTVVEGNYYFFYHSDEDSEDDKLYPDLTSTVEVNLIDSSGDVSDPLEVNLNDAYEIVEEDYERFVDKITHVKGANQN